VTAQTAAAHVSRDHPAAEIVAGASESRFRRERRANGRVTRSIARRPQYGNRRSGCRARCFFRRPVLRWTVDRGTLWRWGSARCRVAQTLPALFPHRLTRADPLRILAYLWASEIPSGSGVSASCGTRRTQRALVIGAGLASGSVSIRPSMMKHRSRLCCLAFASTVVACEPAGTDRPHAALGARAEQLRAAFNADSGKVRVVMLASPT
jgi:hypothetical protein